MKLIISLLCVSLCASAWAFDGKYFAGEGDEEYLQLLDISARMFHPDPEFQNMSMLYTPAWNGFVEGPTWGAWWIQNSYGTTYCSLPFLEEPYLTFLQNAQDLWFNQMGDGKRKGAHDWVAPDGCLCDAAAPGLIYYKQGDGKINIHDWGMEFTAAGIVMQAELLLTTRDKSAIEHYLPMLGRSADFIESRRDPKNNLFLAGPAGNLLAPSYAGWKKPDGTYDKAYLAGLSVTYIAALDRLIELSKLAGKDDLAAEYTKRRDLAKQGLSAVTTGEGYLVKYLDPDGTKHGVYGAPKHGYFEAVCNHDAIAFRVVDEDQSARIYQKIASIPGLRPHDLIITNYPGLDDMYEPPTSWLWKFGTWVNGGHWTTCEARMMMAYSIVGAYEDNRKAMKQIMSFARKFRMDNPLVDFGNEVYQPKEPVNITVDAFGAPAGMIRGLFEYQYKADSLVIVPHISPTIERLEQKFPIRFGQKRIYLSVSVGEGKEETINGKAVNGVYIPLDPPSKGDGKNDAPSKGELRLTYADLPDEAYIHICVRDGTPFEPTKRQVKKAPAPAPGDKFYDLSDLGVAGGNLHPLRIGSDSGGSNKFVGDISRIRLYDKALSDAQVAEMAANADATPVSPLADFDFGKLEGNRIAGAFPAEVRGKVTAVEETQGRKVGHFTNDGYMETPHDSKLMFQGAFAVDARLRYGDLPEAGGRIVDKVTAGNNDGYLLDTCPGKSLRFITEYGTVAVNQPLPVPADKLFHVAAVCDPGKELALYINGKKAATSPSEKKPPMDLPLIGKIYNQFCEKGKGDSYEACHAEVVLEAIQAVHERAQLKRDGKLAPLDNERSQFAADKSYIDTIYRLADGFLKTIRSYEKSTDPAKQEVYKLCADLLK